MTLLLFGIKTPEIMNFCGFGVGCQPREREPVRPDGLAREKSNISLPGCQATRCLGTSHMDIWECGSEVSWQPGSLAERYFDIETSHSAHFSSKMLIF